MRIRLAGPDHCPQLAGLHALCFEEAWSTEACAELVRQPNIHALLATETQEKEPCGFIVIRIAADECEILTLGIGPEHRRRRTASELVRAAADVAQCKGATCVFLEVGLNNIAARQLYGKLGFEQVGMRKNYYRRRSAPAEDARLLKAALPLAPSA